MECLEFGLGKAMARQGILRFTEVEARTRALRESRNEGSDAASDSNECRAQRIIQVGARRFSVLSEVAKPVRLSRVLHQPSVVEFISLNPFGGFDLGAKEPFDRFARGG